MNVNKLKLEGEPLGVIKLSDIEKDVPNTKQVDKDVFEYTLLNPVSKDKDGKMLVKTIVMSEPPVGRMKDFKMTEDQTMGNMLILIFACSDLEFSSTADKIKFKDVINLIKIASSFLS